MTIIQVRGTSGSGKSTVMRAVMKQLGEFHGVTVAGRKQPMYYQLDWRHGSSKPVGFDLCVLGHYATACGGCDTIGSAKAVIELIDSMKHWDVILCEGLLLSEDVKNTLTLPIDRLKVLFLTTPLDTCLERIKGRRATAGNDKPLNVANTSNRVATIERARARLEDAGVFCRMATSEQAPSVIMAWLQQVK